MHRLPALLAAAFCLLVSGLTAAADVERTGGPFVPTPQVVVDAMLEFARVGPRDFVVDLGSGDGRIVLTAAERFSARGVGFDIDPDLVKSSNAEAKKRGLAERVSFREQDVLQARIEDATVVTLYLLPGMMQQLQAKFARELKPGTRIVSHDFPFGDWKPDREVVVDVPEKYGTPGQWKSTLYYWLVPARVNGDWTLEAPGVLAQPVTVNFDQQYQTLRGGYTEDGRRVAVSAGRLEAARITFKLMLAGGAFEFRGNVEGDQIRGEAVNGTRTLPFSARKLATSAR